MRNFWLKLKRKNQPIIALAPMAGITDNSFRQICKEFGADIVYSEMASATALVYSPNKTLEMLYFENKERPYIVQLFGSNPEHFSKAVKIITQKIKPDGIDINFGCPVKKVVKQGAGAVLMNDLPLAHEIIKTSINNTNLPISIKCRSQVSKVNVLDFLKYISDLDVKAVMIHGRNLNQGHSGPVDFQVIKESRKYFKGIILANGGVKDSETAFELLKKTKADGIGIGQGALGKPWIFKQVKNKNNESPDIETIKQIIIRHSKSVFKIKGSQGVKEMRKHLCWYVSGFNNASELRREFVKVETIEQIAKILKFNISNNKTIRK